MAKAESASKSIAGNLITQIINQPLTIIVGIIVTRLLGPEIKGLHAFLLLLASFYAPLLLFGYNGGVIFFLLRKRLIIKDYFYSGFLWVFSQGFIIAALLLLLTQFSLLGEIGSLIDIEYRIIFLACIPFSLATEFMNRCIRSERLFNVINRRDVLSGVINVILLSIFVIALKMSLVGVVLAYFLHTVFRFGTSFYFIIKQFKPTLKIVIKDIFVPSAYGFRFWINDTLNYSNAKIDQVILSFFLAPARLGIYVVGVAFSNMLLNIPSSYLNVAFNKMVSEKHEKRMELFRLVHKFTLFMGLVFLAILAFTGYFLITLFYGKEFTESYFVLLLYLPGVLFYLGSRSIVKYYSAIAKPHKITYMYLVSVLGSLPLYVIFIPIFDVLGAAFVSSIAYLLFYLTGIVQLRRAKEIFFREFFIPTSKEIGTVKSVFNTFAGKSLSKFSIVRGKKK